MPPRPADIYNPVASVSPEINSPNDYINARATPEAFGSRVGQALQRAGATGEQLGDRAIDVAIQAETLFNEANSQAAQDRWMQQANDILHNPKTGFYAQKEGQAVAAYQPSLDALTKSRQEIRDTLPNDRQKLMFDQLTRRMYDYMQQDMGRHVDQEGTKYATGQLAGSIDQNIRSASLAWNQDGPNSLFSYNLGQALAKTQNLGETLGWSQEQIDAKKAETTSRAWHARISMAMQQDLPYARKLLTENQDKLDPQLQAQLTGQLEQKETLEQNRALTEQMRSMALQDKIRREAAESAGNGFVTQMLKDPTKVDPAAIADDPHLTYEQKWSITNMLHAELQGKAQGKDTTTYGPGFWDIYQRIHAPENDPTRITDPSQLYQLAGPNGQLTVAGVDKLTQEIMGRRSPEGEAEAEMKKVFLQNARAQITGTNEGLHIRDPKGDELYLKFLAQALPAYDAGKRAGKSPAQLLNPDSPDYVGKSIAAFRRPLSQWTADMLRDNVPEAASPGAEAQAGAPDLATPEGLVAAVRAGRISRAEGERIALRNGWIRAPQPTAPIAGSR